MALRDDDSSSTSFGWQRPALPNVAHFDLFSGAAGDMMLAACLVRKPFCFDVFFSNCSQHHVNLLNCFF
jgi:hypothetical protein